MKYVGKYIFLNHLILQVYSLESEGSNGSFFFFVKYLEIKNVKTCSMCMYHKNRNFVLKNTIVKNSCFPTLSITFRMLNAVKQSSGNEKDLLICDLGRMCPSLQDVKSSVDKLKAIVLTGEIN